MIGFERMVMIRGRDWTPNGKANRRYRSRMLKLGTWHKR